MTITTKLGGDVITAFTVNTTASGIIWVQFICAEPDTRMQDHIDSVFVFGVDSETKNQWIEQRVCIGNLFNQGGYTVSYSNKIHDLCVYYTPVELLKTPRSLMKHDVGSKVQIVANTSGHIFSHGQVLIVDEQMEESNMYVLLGAHNAKCAVSDDDIVKH
jgi:hypothetical protein